MKRIFSLCLLLALAGIMSAQEGAPAHFPYTGEQDRVIENDVIVVMGSSNFDPSTPAGAYLQAVARLFESQNPGITVQLEYGSWGDLWNKVGVMLGNRQGPDLVVGPRDYLMASGRGGGQWEDIITVPDQFFVSDLEKQAMGPALLEASRFPGRPGYMVWPWQTYIDGVMVVNGDMLREAGYDPLEIQQNGWTVEQFREIAQAVTRDTDGDGQTDQWAAYYGPMGGHNGDRIWQLGIYTTDHPFRLTPQGMHTATYIDIETGELFLDEEGFLRGWQLLRQMIDEDGVIPENTVGVSMDESREAFTTGMTAFSFDGPDLLNLVNERNRRIELGLEQGETIDAYVVRRPHFDGPGTRPFPIAVLSHGFYSFKQEPYKGDAHTRNVFAFARFLTNPVFQVRLAYDQSIPPDARVHMGEQSWFPGILGTGPNGQFVQSLREVWQPRMGIYLQMATTPQLQEALQRFEAEVVQPTRDEVALGRITPEQAVERLRQGLERVSQQVPLEQRLTEDAPRLAQEINDFARRTGQ